MSASSFGSRRGYSPLEEFVNNKWRMVAQISSNVYEYRRIVGCGVKRSFRMYAKDGFYRSGYSSAVSGNSFDCK